MAAPALSDASNCLHRSARVRSNLAGIACLHLWPVERTERSQMLKLHCRCKLLHVKRKSMADRDDFCSRFLVHPTNKCQIRLSILLYSHIFLLLDHIDHDKSSRRIRSYALCMFSSFLLVTMSFILVKCVVQVIYIIDKILLHFSKCSSSFGCRIALDFLERLTR